MRPAAQKEDFQPRLGCWNARGLGDPGYLVFHPTALCWSTTVSIICYLSYAYGYDYESDICFVPLEYDIAGRVVKAQIS